MNSYLFIDGFQFWMIIIVLAIIVVALISLGRGYLAEVHKNYRLQRRLMNAKEEAAEWESMYTIEKYKHGGQPYDEF